MTITYRQLGKVGRLGNALFELASTIGIAAVVGEPFSFPTDWLHRPYFSIPDEKFNDDPPDPKEATEFATHIEIRARPYLQDIRLFWEQIDLIRSYLKPSPYAQELLDFFALPPRPRLGIHVRRGDNVFDPGIPNKADYHSCPDLEYYMRGVAQLGPSLPRVVVSDDIPWCREMIKAEFYGDGRAYWKEHEPQFGTEPPSDWIDLFLLAQCDYFVISGSTFGIWGAILANVPPDHVVRPDKVYGPLVSHVDENLLFHPQWKVQRSAP